MKHSFPLQSYLLTSIGDRQEHTDILFFVDPDWIVENDSPMAYSALVGSDFEFLYHTLAVLNRNIDWRWFFAILSS